MEPEWDDRKHAENVRKHGVGFEEAATVIRLFGDPLEVNIPDPDHSVTEQRFLSMGHSEAGRVLVVSYVERISNTIRNHQREGSVTRGAERV